MKKQSKQKAATAKKLKASLKEKEGSRVSFTVRLPRTLWELVTLVAHNSDLSMQQVVVRAVREHCDKFHEDYAEYLKRQKGGRS
jgi:hypothetical protein